MSLETENKQPYYSDILIHISQPDIGLEFKLILNMNKYMIKIMAAVKNSLEITLTPALYYGLSSALYLGGPTGFTSTVINKLFKWSIIL